MIDKEMILTQLTDRIKASGDQYWISKIEVLRDSHIHVAVMVEPYITKIMKGEKTIESRFSQNKIVPWKRVFPGDIIIIKRSGGGFESVFEAGKVISKEIMSPAEVEQIKNDFNDRLCIEDDWWERKSKSRYATLIPITHLLGFDPFVIKFKNRQAWLELYQPNQDDKELASEDVIGDEEPSVASKMMQAPVYCIEKAITQNGARLIILDPIQAYMGEKTDMNRANEVRPMFRRLADVAERTGCAVILIGHLNKAAGGQSAYRGLGSIDFRAAARSVLLIGRVKREPNVRVIVHDKSSLAPEGKPVAFCLDPETGFEWIGEYDITADELLSGAGGNTATKTEQAERLILDLLAGGKELASEDIVKAAAEAGISERTVQNAKRNMGGILGARRVGGQWYNFIKKKQPPEPAS